MLTLKPALLCLQLMLTVTRGAIQWPDYESGWLPITAGPERVARLNLEHGLGEVPLLVDVSVKVNFHILPASGFRPDHEIDQSGPAVYIYDAKYVNVSTTPNINPFFTPFSPYEMTTQAERPWLGKAHVRVWAWKESTLTQADFRKTDIYMKANTSKDSYAEIVHNLDETPCLVVVRMKMQHNGNILFADGVGSSMQVYYNEPGKTNAYLVYGYSNTTFRMWVDSSKNGAVFDGRKHTWFDFVISEGTAEIYAWRHWTLRPFYNDLLAPDSFTSRDRLTTEQIYHYLQYALVRGIVESEDSANESYRFPGTMYLAETNYSSNLASNTTESGGLFFYYSLFGTLYFWKSSKAHIFIGSTFGGGKNVEYSNSNTFFIQTWIYEGDRGCNVPVIPHGYADTSVNGTSVGSTATVVCDNGYVLHRKYERDFQNGPPIDAIECFYYGFWTNVPRCLPIAKDLGVQCNPVVDQCKDLNAVCNLVPDRTDYRCLCNEGYITRNGKCKTSAKYFPKRDFESGWRTLDRTSQDKWFLTLEHRLNTVPVLVDIQVYISGYIFPALGVRPNHKPSSVHGLPVIFMYDERFINISSWKTNSSEQSLSSFMSSYSNGVLLDAAIVGSVRVRAWRAERLPTPDLRGTSHILRANTSKAKDSFYELFHNFGEYPGIITVRAKMNNKGRTVYANGVGSAQSVFYGNSDQTNAFLVYGYSKNSIRAWVDSSKHGAIFDGRKHTRFDFTVSEAVVEIFAWKISTLTPSFSTRFPMGDEGYNSFVALKPSTFNLIDGLTIAVSEVVSPSAKNHGFRFPGSTYVADRRENENIETTTETNKTDECVFGGFVYGFKTDQSIEHRNKTNMFVIKPYDVQSMPFRTGPTVCIPESFGNGENTEAVFDGIGILYSWLPGDCSAIDAPAGGTLYGTGYNIGNIIEFQCQAGYELMGNETIECLSSGNWSQIVPSCVSIGTTISALTCQGTAFYTFLLYLVSY